MNEYKPQIGDILQRECGGLGIIEHVSPLGMVLRVRIMHLPNIFFPDGAIITVPTKTLGKTWHVFA